MAETRERQLRDAQIIRNYHRLLMTRVLQEQMRLSRNGDPNNRMATLHHRERVLQEALDDDRRYEQRVRRWMKKEALDG